MRRACACARTSLRHLGPTWALYGLKGRPGDRSKAPVLVAEVGDAEASGKALDTLASRLNAALREAEGGEGDRAPILEFTPLPAPARGYVLTSPAGLVSWLDGAWKPTVRIGKDHVAFAPSPEAAGLALAAEGDGDRARPDGELAGLLAALPAELTSLSVGDPRGKGLAEGVVDLPKFVQAMSLLFTAADAEPPVGASAMLALAGIPRPGGFRVRGVPGGVPKAEEIEAHLFPSVIATAVDGRGLHIIAREAFPLAGWSSHVNFKASVTATNDTPKPTLKLKLGFSTGKK